MTKPIGIFLSQEAENEHMFKVFSREVREQIAEYVEAAPVTISAAELEAGAGLEAEYVFSTWGMAELTEAQIRKYLPKLKAVFYAAGSVQYFARPFLACGAKVYSAWAANAVPVVEYAVAQIILANKGYFSAARNIKTMGYDKARAINWVIPGNYNAKVGIIGCGMIGSMVCERLQQYKLDVLVYDPFAPDEKLEKLGARRATLEEIFSQCQTVSNHTANLPQTVGMLHYAHFSKLLPSATFINTGRGAQVVEADMIRALEEKPGRTAVLDVTFPEPPEADSPLWTLPNVVLTPHIAGSLGQEIERMGAYMAEELRRSLTGEDTLYCVTEKMLETMA